MKKKGLKKQTIKKIEQIEQINLTDDELMELFNGVYFKSNKYELNGEFYQQISKINTSDHSDGPSWDYIIQRISDSKFFKFNVWDAGDQNGYIFEDKFLIQVFKKHVITYE